MTPVEVFATILAVLVIVKMVVVVISPQAWIKAVAMPVMQHKGISMVVYALLLVVSGYYLLPFIGAAEFGATLFVAMLLIGISFLPFARLFKGIADEVAAEGLGKYWFPVIIWLGIAVWILKSIWF